MKLSSSLFFFMLYSNFLTQNCLPFNKLQDNNYTIYFPGLTDYYNTEIIDAINNFENNTNYSGEGGYGIVKIFDFNNKQQGRVKLAIKAVKQEWKRSFLLQIEEHEIKQWLKVNRSKYVPTYYACIESPENSENAKTNTVFIIQQALQYDIRQKPQNNGIVNNRNIMIQLPDERDRILFYSKLFRALEDISRYGITHNDIKPQNIMVGDEGYFGQPYIIDFGISNQQSAKPHESTPCYEYKNKKNLYNNSPKLDVFSMGITIIEIETQFTQLCAKFRPLIGEDYDSLNQTQEQIDTFFNIVQSSLQLESLEPDVNDIQECQSLKCIILFTIQPKFGYIPFAASVAYALEKLYEQTGNRLII